MVDGTTAENHNLLSRCLSSLDLTSWSTDTESGLDLIVVLLWSITQTAL
jgi:hypothetical protein